MYIFIGPAVAFIFCFFILNFPLTTCLVGAIGGIFVSVLIDHVYSNKE